MLTDNFVDWRFEFDGISVLELQGPVPLLPLPPAWLAISFPRSSVIWDDLCSVSFNHSVNWLLVMLA